MMMGPLVSSIRQAAARLLRLGICGLVLLAVPASAAGRSYHIETVAQGLDNPYAVALLPDGEILVTEKPGRLRLIRNGVLVKRGVSGVPKVLTAFNDGLMDVVAHPRFSQNHLLFFSMTRDVDGKQRGYIVRARYANGTLTDVKNIFRVGPIEPRFSAFSAGRMAFLSDGTLVFTVAAEMDENLDAQDPGSTQGKTIRITADGRIPRNNPFVGKRGVNPAIYSFGHRTPLGILFDPVTARLYATENGPRGGDELNLIRPGKNYGWPVVTYGREYLGGYTSPFQRYPGMERPLIDWTPSPAPSGLAQCRRCQWPEWEGDLLAGMMAGRHVKRIHLKGDIVVEREKLFTALNERIRDVRFGPEGALYLLTDGPNAKLLKVSRALSPPPGRAR